MQKNGSHAMDIDGDTVYGFFSALKERYPDAEVVTIGELGESFRRENKDNSALDYRFVHKGTGKGGSLADVQITWYMNDVFRMALKKNLRTGEERVIDFTDYTKNYSEPADSDYLKGESNRSWSLLGDINQKGLRPQDTPVPFGNLTEKQKTLFFGKIKDENN